MSGATSSGLSCRCCGSSLAREVDVDHLGVTVATIGLCDRCLRDEMGGLRLWKAEFERLLRSGVSQEDANNQLSARIMRGESPPELRS